jgi:hypothetical protein
MRDTTPPEEVATGTPETGKEEREAPPIVRNYEYKDAQGRLLGRAELTLAPEPVDLPFARAKDKQPTKGRKVLSFVLRGEKDGVPTELDILPFADPHGTEVIAADEHIENYQYEDDKGRAFVPPLESPLDVSVLLHELGHADQFRDARYQPLVPFYGRAQKVAAGVPLASESMLEMLEAVTQAVPDARRVMSADDLAQLGRLRDRVHDEKQTTREQERTLAERENVREATLATFVFDLLGKRTDVRKLDQEIHAAVESTDGAAPDRVAKRTASLADRLEALGFRFGRQVEAMPMTGSGFPNEWRRFGKRQDPAASPAELRTILRTFIEGGEVRTSDLRYDPASKRLSLKMRVPYDASRGAIVGIELEAEPEEFEAYARGRATDDEQVAFMEGKVAEASERVRDAEHAATRFVDLLGGKDVAMLPSRMMERDATRRALQWMRTIRERTGVDLFAAHHVAPESLVANRTRVPDGDCVGSTAAGVEAGEVSDKVEVKVLKDLKDALASYGADDLRLRPDDEGGSVTPIAGYDRDEPKDPSPS